MILLNYSVFILLLSWTIVTHGAPHQDHDHFSKCGYESCPQPKAGVLNVHLISHTHDDVGWLKTVDQYYYGSNTTIQKAGVQYILDSVIDELAKDPSKRFIYVETAFLWKWWQKQGDQTRHHVQRLVREGRLEMISGAWSMNDEATTNYQSIVDQFTWGLRKLNDTFGECGRPRVGWQIDPFGHSREMANLLAGMGYDGLFLGRIDYQDKSNRFKTGQPEMIWRGNDDLKGPSDLFTGVLFNNYSPPPGFCFDILCSDDPIIDDPDSPDNNVRRKVQLFMEYVTRANDTYGSGHVAITMGDDFNYQDAKMWFINLDRLIKYVNLYGNEDGPKINVFYSTPSCYLKALHDSNIKWPTKQDDFFPYASDPHAYWTGYFTSKPAIKYFERKGNNFLQVCKQLYAMNHLAEKDLLDLNALRSAMGIMQHHDAVTGTEKEHVAKDYERILDLGMQDCLIPSNEALSKRIDPQYEQNKESNINLLPMTLCNWNQSECYISENSEAFVITIYNPLSHEVWKPVRLPILSASYNVIDNDGAAVTTQVVPIPPSILSIVSRNSSATHELVFIASKLPPLGYKSYYVARASSHNVKRTAPQLVDSHSDENENYLGSDELRVQFKDGNSMEITLNGQKDNLVTQNFMYYEGETGNNEVFENRSSGAYIFRPKTSTPVDIGTSQSTMYKGPVVEEAHQVFNEWVSQVVRIYPGYSDFVEFEWTVGPIPIDDNLGKEVISRFSTELNTNEEFFTDSNGRQMLKRKLNKRPAWTPEIQEAAAGNYYPVTSRISIQDEDNNLQFSVLVDRSQGGASLNNGQVELMVHRRLLHDDAFGVGEALNETRGGLGLVARGRHVMQLGALTDKGSRVQETKDKIKTVEELLSPWVFISDAGRELSLDQWKLLNNVNSGLKKSLPPSVHIMTLEPWRDNSILLRLEHLLEAADDPEGLSKATQVDLSDLFTELQVKTVRETTLGGNHWLDRYEKMTWETASDFVDSFNDVYDLPVVDDKTTTKKEASKPTVREGKDLEDNGTVITLKPMEIRTFIITATKN